MKATFAAILLTTCIPVVISTVHTTCFNYFLQKDGCVFSSASEKTRCAAPAKDHPAPVQAFSLRSKSKRSELHSLERRYDTTKPSFPIGGGDGICGFYNSTTEIGVCLWSGAEQNNPTVYSAGWLNGAKTSNCKKRVYVQRTGQPGTVKYVKVLDGCSFDTKDRDVGCTQIGLSIALFNLFEPSDKEKADQLIYGGLTWDFDNIHGQSPQQAPV